MTPHTVAGHFGELLQGRLGPSGPLALITLPTRGLQPSPPATTPPAPSASTPPARRPSPATRPPASTAASPARRFAAPSRSTPPCPPAAAPAPPPPPCSPPPPPSPAAARTRRKPSPASATPSKAPPTRSCTPRPAPSSGPPAPPARSAAFPPLPAFHVAGGFLGPGRRTDPGDLAFADIADLAAAWPAAAARRDLAALAALATESARRNARHRHGPDLAPLLAAAERHGALGIVAAHTGSALGLLFAAPPPDAALADLRALGLARVARFRAGGRP